MCVDVCVMQISLKYYVVYDRSSLPYARLYMCFVGDTAIKDTTNERQRPYRRLPTLPPLSSAHLNSNTLCDRTPRIMSLPSL